MKNFHLDVRQKGAPQPAQKANLQSLKRFPYSLARDLAALAFAIKTLHQSNLSLNGFSIERALGSYVPELQLTPGRLPQEATPTRTDEDYKSLVKLIASCFSINEEDLWPNLIQHLNQTMLLTKAEYEKLVRREPHSISHWGQALVALCDILIENKSSHFAYYMKNELRMENRP